MHVCEETSIYLKTIIVIYTDEYVGIFFGCAASVKNPRYELST